MTVGGKGEGSTSWWIDSYEQTLTFKTRISFWDLLFPEALLPSPPATPWSLVNEDLHSQRRKCSALEAVFTVPRGSLEKRNPRKHRKIQDSKWAGCWGLETHRAENSEQKPSAFESPARLAGGAPRTSALGLGDTPSSHTSPADPGARRTRGWCFQSCSLLSRRAGARDPPAVRAIQSHRLGGKKIGAVPGTVALEGRPRAAAGVQEFQGLGKGEGNLWNPTPLAKENFAGWWVGAASRAVIAGMCSHPLGGFAERLACEKEVRRGWGDVGRWRGTPDLERGSGCERLGSAASTRDSGAGVVGARMSQKTGWCLSLFWSSPIKQLVGILKKEPGLAMSVSFHLYLKDNRNNNSSSSSCVSRFI